MPRYWILCMSEDNYEIARTQGLIGLAERHKIAMQKFVIGDMMTFYISKKKVDSPANDSAHKVQQFRGIARVTSDAFESNDLIWHVRDGEIFPHRMCDTIAKSCPHGTTHASSVPQPFIVALPTPRYADG